MHPLEHNHSNLLPFQRPQAPTFPAGMPELSMEDAEQLPFDIASLRRPVPVVATAPPVVSERDALAHDARNAMASLELLADLLAEPGVLAPEFQRYVQDLRAVKGTAAILIGRLVNLGDRDAGRPSHTASLSVTEATFVREPLRPRLSRQNASVHSSSGTGIDAGTMVEDCAQLLSAIAGPLVRVKVARDRNVGECPLSGEEMTRVLMNLVKNASEAMPKGGDVSISVRQGARLGARKSILLEVKDNGPGIPAHALGQIFQAGFTSKTARAWWPASDHHGLGLAIVRGLIESRGGSIRVSSALGKGTTFEIKLPCR
jgi:signal transduction histidine kinase